MLQQLYTLLKSNDHPPAPVARHVRQQLNEAKTELDHVEAQMQTLRQRAHALKRTIVLYKTVLSPIRLVPDDVLAEIFSHSLQSYSECASVKQKNVPPILFTHVCHRWRIVAHSSPALWREIIVKLPPNVTLASGGNLKMVDDNAIFQQIKFVSLQTDRMQEWLKRSGALPLSLQLHQVRLISDGLRLSSQMDLNQRLAQRLSRMFLILSAFLPRCERLTLTILSGSIYKLFSAHITPAQIEGIKHFHPDIDIQPQELITTPLFTSLPALRNLHISPNMNFMLHEQYPRAAAFTPDVWQNLTTITTTALVTITQAAAVLERCPSLVHLKLSVYEHSRTMPHQTSVKEYLMANLEQLSITFSPLPVRILPHYGTTIEKYNISAPHLQRLQYTVQKTLELSNAHDVNSISGFSDRLPLDFMLRSSKHLTELVVSPGQIENKGLEFIRETTSRLASLVIVGSLRLPHIILQQYVDNGYSVVSETDSGFLTLFPLPEWCKLPSFAAPVPLMTIEGLDTDELDKALGDQICPRLEHLELPGLHSIRNDTLLSFIVYRLRLYEYACLKWGDNVGQDVPFAPLTRLSARILGTRMDTVDITKPVQKLASVIGVPFHLKVEYPDSHETLASYKYLEPSW